MKPEGIIQKVKSIYEKNYKKGEIYKMVEDNSDNKMSNMNKLLICWLICVLAVLIIDGIWKYQKKEERNQKEIALHQLFESKYGENYTIENSKKTTFNHEEVERYFITVPSATKVVDKGYYVLCDENNKIIKDQKLTDKELAISSWEKYDEGK